MLKSYIHRLNYVYIFLDVAFFNALIINVMCFAMPVLF
ncbi:MAG: hypothetical protein JWR12_169 [Mucilaginibacter sp.]|nr:hypothetical protein [Mucilaginibacter sp.]